MKEILTAIVLSLTIIFSCSSPDNIITNTDINLIIPGHSAEGLKLGEKIDAEKYKIYNSGESSIADILNADYFSDIKFDSVIPIGNASIILPSVSIRSSLAIFCPC